MRNEVRVRSRSMLAIGLITVVLAACAGDASPSSGESGPPGASAGASARPAVSPSPTSGGYRIGVSTAVTGDGWHDAMVCSANAEARASGRVETLTVSDRRTDGAGQAADLRNLVATGVDAIVVAPLDPPAITDAVTEAIAAGVVVVSVGRPLEVDGAISVATDQGAYGSTSATWLFERLEGKGSVVYLRGAADDPVDTARDAGFRTAVEAFPDIEVVFEAQTEGDPALAVEQVNAFLATEKDVDGIWTGGTDAVVVDALKAAEVGLVPIVGGDRGSFVSQLLAEEQLVGVAVTDSPAVGGAGITLALEALDGSSPPDPLRSVTPELWPNDTDAGRAALARAFDPDIPLEWPLSISLPGLTSYTTEDLVACAGPER